MTTKDFRILVNEIREKTQKTTQHKKISERKQKNMTSCTTKIFALGFWGTIIGFIIMKLIEKH